MNTEVYKLCVTAGTSSGTIGDIHWFQSMLTTYKITVFGDLSGKLILYEGVGGETPNNLLLINNHYNVFVKLTAAFSTVFCEKFHSKYKKLH